MKTYTEIKTNLEHKNRKVQKTMLVAALILGISIAIAYVSNTLLDIDWLEYTFGVIAFVLAWLVPIGIGLTQYVFSIIYLIQTNNKELVFHLIISTIYLAAIFSSGFHIQFEAKINEELLMGIGFGTPILLALYFWYFTFFKNRKS